MRERVLRRFILLLTVATVAMFMFWTVRAYLSPPLGDYEVRQGDILLSDGKYDEAIARFEAALKASPHHRGAMMGRAIALLESGRNAEAERAFNELIKFLEASLTQDDPTGRGVLASAYANRGILHDRAGDYRQALADYRQALTIDKGAVKGPGLVHRILYGNAQPSTVRDRAAYLQEQLALPEDKRVMRMPEIDKRQRMYKP